MIVIFILSTMIFVEIFKKKQNLELTRKHIDNAVTISKFIHLLQLERAINTELAADEMSSKKEKLTSIKKELDVLLKNSTIDNNKALLNRLKKERNSLDINSLTINEIEEFYSLTISMLVDIINTIPNSMNDLQNRNYIQAYTHLILMKESLGKTRAVLNKSFIKKEFQDDDFARLSEFLKTYHIAQKRFENILSDYDDFFYFYKKSLNDEKNKETFEIINFVLNNKENLKFENLSHVWFEKVTHTIDTLKKVENVLFINVINLLEKKQKSNFHEMILVLTFLIISIIALIFQAITIIREILTSTNFLESNLSKSTSLLQQYKSAVDESAIVSKTDKDGIITYVNEKFCKINGYAESELLGKPHNIIKHPDMPKEIFADLWQTIKHLKQPWVGDIKNLKKDGTAYWAKTFIKPILDANDNVIEFIAIRTDITQIIEQRLIFESIANTDTLTNYANRYKLNKDIDEKHNLSIALFNIDNFRELNDFYGHSFGDSVIKSVADKIYNFISRDKRLSFYRLQGDEFALLATEYEKDLFIYKCRDVLLLIKEDLTIKNEKIILSCSCGIAFEDKSHLLPKADMALKIAKQQNSDFIVYSDEISLNSKYENNINCTKKLVTALQNNQMTTFYQPIVNNTTLKFEKYEALIRMIDEDSTIISPFYFLDIAKKTKKYFDITKIVIAQSFEMFKDKEAEFSVNLSIVDILEPEIVKYILMMLEKYNIGSKVVFEIVESEYIENFQTVINFIDDVKRYGCKIAIDDFGTGYSNFEYLIKIKADYLKIDGSLIKNIDTDKNAFLVVSTIVEFSKKLGMQTIAEFVENEAIFKIVKELGIDYSQGYYFSAPQEKLIAY
ncbi:MAG: EAL domain-containing protein [Sulfurimonas sp.]|nr:EAL domain-containing protein [Sulfurimonas sp.]